MPRRCDITVTDVAPYYVFQKDFSRFLRRLVLKFPNGLKGKDISNAILERIEHSKLTEQDIKHIVVLNNKRMMDSVMYNTLIPDRYKYRLILSNRVDLLGAALFRDRHLVYQHLVNQIKNLDKYYLKGFKYTVLWIVRAAVKLNKVTDLPTWARIVAYTEEGSSYLGSVGKVSIRDIIKASQIRRLYSSHIVRLVPKKVNVSELCDLMSILDKDYTATLVSELINHDLLDIDFHSFMTSVIPKIAEAGYFYRSEITSILTKLIDLYQKEVKSCT